jgi:hypothetical protein
MSRDDISGLDRYIQSLYKSFPSVDSKTGIVYLKPQGQTGLQASKNSRLLSEKELATRLSQSFPQGAVHHVTRPELRAQCHKASGGQMTLTGQTLNKWTIDYMKKAAAEFEVPKDTKILLIFPEVFNRDILLRATGSQIYSQQYGTKRSENTMSMVSLKQVGQVQRQPYYMWLPKSYSYLWVHFGM